MATLGNISSWQQQETGSPCLLWRQLVILQLPMVLNFPLVTHGSVYLVLYPSQWTLHILSLVPCSVNVKTHSYLKTCLQMP